MSPLVVVVVVALLLLLILLVMVAAAVVLAVGVDEEGIDSGDEKGYSDNDGDSDDQDRYEEKRVNSVQ